MTWGELKKQMKQNRVPDDAELLLPGKWHSDGSPEWWSVIDPEVHAEESGAEFFFTVRLFGEFPPDNTISLPTRGAL